MSGLDAAIRAKLAADEAGDEYWPNYKAAIEAVLDLHQPPDAPLDPIFRRYCRTCGAYYEYPVACPCPTVVGIAEKLGVTGR